MKKQGVGQCLGKNNVGFFHEHDGFAEALSLAENFDDFFIALWGGEGELYLPVNQKVKTSAGIALVKKDAAFAGIDFACRAGDPGNLFRRKSVKERYVG